MKNRKLSEETKQKIREKRKLQPSTMLGKHHSEEAKNKMRLAREGETWEEVFGVEKAKEMKEKARIRMANLRGRYVSPETCKKISTSKMGVHKGMTYEQIYGEEKAKELKRIRAEFAHAQKGIPKPGVSKALKGRSFPSMFKKRSNPHPRKEISMIEEYGEERAREITAKRTRTVKERGCFKGEKNPRWRGGISLEPYSFEFQNSLKQQIKERDNYTCQKCGNKEKLVVHHIDYNKKNCSLNNLLTLCNVCNSTVNNGRDFWKGYFLGRLHEKFLQKQQKSIFS